jgi:cell wall-associated NlpC family hydrolase
MEMMNRRFLLTSVGVSLLWGCSTDTTYLLPAPSRQEPSPSQVRSSKRQDIVMHAMAMLDRGYTYGGKKLHTGFDCSGLVSFVYQESAGIAIKGSAFDMARAARVVPPEQASPGDLVFFNTLGSPFSHVGIYIGADKFIHAANEKTGVTAELLSRRYWARRFQGYRTLLA